MKKVRTLIYQDKLRLCKEDFKEYVKMEVQKIMVYLKRYFREKVDLKIVQLRIGKAIRGRFITKRRHYIKEDVN